MKLQIDTEAKTIKLEQSAKLTDIISAVKKLFPNDEWKQYSLEAVTIINNWTNPVVIHDWVYNPYPLQPSWWTGGSGLSGSCNTVCNLEISNQ